MDKAPEYQGFLSEALDLAKEILARDLTDPLWPNLTESDWDRDAKFIARHLLRVEEHLAMLKDAWWSTGEPVEDAPAPPEVSP